MWWWFGCAGSDADISSLPAVPDPPVVPAVGAAPVVERADSPSAVPEGLSWPLDGEVGAVADGVSLYVAKPTPPVLELVDGAVGVVIRGAPQGLQLLCTRFTPVTGPIVVQARTQILSACTTEGCKVPSVQLRSFGADGKPVGPPARIGGLGVPGGWNTSRWNATPLPGATQVRVCFGVPEGDAVVAIDWIAV